MMRIAILGALLVTTVATASMSTPAVADAVDAGACYTITDPDARTYCRAKAHGESSFCYSIQRPDLKAMCLAEVRK